MYCPAYSLVYTNIYMLFAWQCILTVLLRYACSEGLHGPRGAAWAGRLALRGLLTRGSRPQARRGGTTGPQAIAYIDKHIWICILIYIYRYTFVYDIIIIYIYICFFLLFKGIPLDLGLFSTFKGYTLRNWILFWILKGIPFKSGKETEI